MAPTAYLEQLEYDTRLMNQAIKSGREEVIRLQRLFVDSDVFFDPQAFVLSPAVVVEVSKEIVKGENYIDATKRGCSRALGLIREAIKSGQMFHDAREDEWITVFEDDIEAIPTEESDFIEMILPTIDQSKVLLDEYGL
jgi:methanol--5-hydroxybenzimidazolylcobamide Co-methyltransferase